MLLWLLAAAALAAAWLLLLALRRRQPPAPGSIEVGFSVWRRSCPEGARSAFLVTGGAGMLGARVIDEIRRGDRSAHIVAFDLFPPAPDRTRPEVTYACGDLRNRQHFVQALALAKTGGAAVECVFHVAGLLPSCATSYADLHAVNCAATEMLLDECRQSGVRSVVVTSSCSVVMKFSDRSIEGAEGEQMPYPDPDDFVDDYARSKAAGERAALATGPQLPCTVIRPSIIFDRCDRKLGEELLRGHCNVVFDDGAHVPDFVWAVDVARAHWAAFEALRDRPADVAGKVFHAASGQRTTMAGWYGMEDPEHPGRTIWGNPPPRKVPFNAVLTSARFNRFVYSLTGWAPIDYFLDPRSVQFLGRRNWWWDCKRAGAVLGYTPTPLPEAVAAMRAEAAGG
eukprot:TRINITY_DN20650_c0_g1_i1.p1 TRINITY_DN20650_c0_g1~~TRINITY_DN20650_c0_g1_i1.p1  ORF type:complete len:422 (+),score=151.40 TRINITY_DN20650_c0_g1_i1:78-1268(+)